MKNVLSFVLLMFVPAISHAFSLENSHIRLLCPQRGQIEITLHRYAHTEELWGKDNFETGAGHTLQGSLLIIPFANQDKMLFDRQSGGFSYWYEDRQTLVRCKLLSILNTNPVDIPYFHE